MEASVSASMAVTSSSLSAGLWRKSACILHSLFLWTKVISESFGLVWVPFPLDVSCTASRQCCQQAGFNFLETIEILAISLCQVPCYGLLFSTLNFMENSMKDAPPPPPHTLIWHSFLIYFNFISNTSFPIYRLKDIWKATLLPWPVWHVDPPTLYVLTAV